MKEAHHLSWYSYTILHSLIYIEQVISHSTRGESKSVEVDEKWFINFILWQSAMFETTLQQKFSLTYTTTRLDLARMPSKGSCCAFTLPTQPELDPTTKEWEPSKMCKVLKDKCNYQTTLLAQVTTLRLKLI